MVGIASAAIYSVLEPISEDTGLTIADLNAGTGYMFLFFVSMVNREWVNEESERLICSRDGDVCFGRLLRYNTEKGLCICSQC